MKFREGIEKLRGLPRWLRDRPRWMQKKIMGDVLDERQERVPIYSYPPRFHALFGTCLVVGTPGIWVARIVLDIAKPGSVHWTTTAENIFDAFPVAGFSAVLVGIISVEVVGVLAELFRNKEADRIFRENRDLKEQVKEVEDLKEQVKGVEQLEEENRRLKEENRRLKEERDQAG